MKRLTGKSPGLFTSCTYVAATIAIALACASTLSAQERLFAFFETGGVPDRDALLVELGTAPGELGAIKHVLRSPDDFGLQQVAPVAGGRYLALIRLVPQTFGVTELYIFDLRTGALLDTGARFTGGGIVASDPRVPRLFIRHYVPDNRYGISVVTLDPFSVSELDHLLPPGPGGGETLVAYTPSRPRLIVGSTDDAVDVVDLSTGQLERTIPRSTSVGIAVDNAGTLYVGRTEGFSAPIQIHAIDLATGGLKASSPFTLPNAPFGPRNYEVVLDNDRRRLLVVPSCPGCVSEPPPLGVLNADTLALEAAVPQSALGNTGPMGPGEGNDVHLHANARNDAYFVWLTRYIRGCSYGGCGTEPQCLHHSLTRLDANTGAVLEQADMRPVLARFSGPCADVIRIQVNGPARPTLSAEVQGNAVTLSWTDPGNTTHFDLEAGSAPGLRNLLVTSLTNRTSFTAIGVPPGTYYLRMRAINEVARSLPSNELQVVVP